MKIDDKKLEKCIEIVCRTIGSFTYLNDEVGNYRDNIEENEKVLSFLTDLRKQRYYEKDKKHIKYLEKKIMKSIE